MPNEDSAAAHRAHAGRSRASHSCARVHAPDSSGSGHPDGARTCAPKSSMKITSYESNCRNPAACRWRAFTTRRRPTTLRNRRAVRQTADNRHHQAPIDRASTAAARYCNQCAKERLVSGVLRNRTRRLAVNRVLMSCATRLSLVERPPGQSFLVSAPSRCAPLFPSGRRRTPVQNLGARVHGCP